MKMLPVCTCAHAGEVTRIDSPSRIRTRRNVRNMDGAPLRGVATANMDTPATGPRTDGASEDTTGLDPVQRLCDRFVTKMVDAKGCRLDAMTLLRSFGFGLALALAA